MRADKRCLEEGIEGAEVVEAAVLSVIKEEWCRVVSFNQKLEGKAQEHTLRCVDPELYPIVEATQNQRAVFLVKRVRNGARIYRNIVGVEQVPHRAANFGAGGEDK